MSSDAPHNFDGRCELEGRCESSPLERRGRFRWWFRIAAVLLGLSVFAAIELCCVIADWGRPEISDDPFVEFSSVRPLFLMDTDGKTFRTAPNRRRYFREDSFAVEKAADEFRIFVLGGSTVQGHPFSTETSFPTYLRIALEQAQPGTAWKVVNCGGVSYASYRLYSVLEECLNYQPDLIIFCGGHNEFLEDVSYQSVGSASPLVQHTFSALNKMRAFRLLRRSWLHLAGPPSRQSAASSITTADRPLSDRPLSDRRLSGRPKMPDKAVLPEEVDTLLDHEGGLAAYHRNDLHAATVARHFHSNLNRMAAVCREHSVPLMMILPPSNDSGCPPFKAEYSAITTSEQRSEIHSLLHKAREVVKKSSSEDALKHAIRLAEMATQMDSRFALSWYELGQFQMSARQFEQAAVSFRRARDEDICPLRMTTSLEAAMKQVGVEHADFYLDAHELLRSKCRTAIVGDSVLVDHVHPSFVGHEEIAIAIVDKLITGNIVQAVSDGWRETARTACREELQKLDDSYFLRGRRTLTNLRLWAAGRSGGPPLSARDP